MLDALLDKSQQAWLDGDSDFLFTVGHELSHSLGPMASVDGTDKKSSLGQFGHLLEENKADVGGLCLVAYMAEQGALTQEQANKIYLNWAFGELPSPEAIDDPGDRSLAERDLLGERGVLQLVHGSLAAQEQELDLAPGTDATVQESLGCM